jgi:hypothetical protein
VNLKTIQLEMLVLHLADQSEELSFLNQAALEDLGARWRTTLSSVRGKLANRHSVQKAKLVQLQQAGTNGYKRKLLTLFLTILGPGAREKTLLTTKDSRIKCWTVLKSWALDKFIKHKLKSPRAVINISTKLEALKSAHAKEKEEATTLMPELNGLELGSSSSSSSKRQQPATKLPLAQSCEEDEQESEEDDDDDDSTSDNDNDNDDSTNDNDNDNDIFSSQFPDPVKEKKEKKAKKEKRIAGKKRAREQEEEADEEEAPAPGPEPSSSEPKQALPALEWKDPARAPPACPPDDKAFKAWKEDFGELDIKAGDWQKLYQACQPEEVASISDLVESMACGFEIDTTQWTFKGRQAFKIFIESQKTKATAEDQEARDGGQVST